MERQPPAKHSHYAFLVVLAASAFALFFGLGRLGFLGPDEPRYAEVAREMFTSGDFISTRLCGCLWFEKPALLYWMTAAGYHLFGVNEFAARVPTAATALATVALVYLVLSQVGARSFALAAALVLGTSGIFIAYARVATPDMLLSASMTAALLAGFQATRANAPARSVYWALSFFFVALAVLAKGLVGIVLVVTILGIYLVVTGRLRSLRVRDWLVGVLVFFVVAGTWYGPVTMRHGWSFVEEFFFRHHFQRYTSNEFGHPQPIYFFVLVAAAGLAPWTFFLIPAVARLRSLKEFRDSLLALGWIWAVVPVLFFSFSESKLPGYILPIFPALAVVIGSEVERVWNNQESRTLRSAAWLTGLTLIGMGIGFLVILHSESINISGWRALLQALPLAIAVISIGALVTNKNRVFITSAAATVLSVILAAVIMVFPILHDEVSLKSLSIEAAAALRPGEKIGFYLKKEFAPVFYAEGRVLCEPKRGGTFYALHQDMLNEALQTEPSLIVITDSKWREGLEKDSRFRTEFIAAQGESLALRVALRRPDN